jgi:hypothetical protein
MGDNIRKLCEAKDFEFSRSWASLRKGMQVCAFCKMMTSLLGRGGRLKEDITISNKTEQDLNISPPTNGIDVLCLKSIHVHGIELAVLTSEGWDFLLLVVIEMRGPGLIMRIGSLAATAEHVSGRCIKAASNLSQSKDWMNECLHNHDHGSSQFAARPSRLLAVGTADGSEPVRIVDDPDPGVQYLTLSYCWGKTGTLCTTAETFGTFRTSIPWERLPKTFQDAIQIARDFGTRYVWIDSLCIIQGDLHDWQTESAKMADIYSGSLLTIMAASASDSHGGCFQDRIATKETVALPYTDTSGITEFSIFVTRSLPGYEWTVYNGPLFQRGWVFQERLMSKRKLIFGEDQTYWECNTVVLSESGIRRRDKFACVNRGQNDAFRIFSDPSYKMEKEEYMLSWSRLWDILVMEYSQCSLTYNTDRLPSLSGLARAFAQKSGHAYVAGLWQDQMPHSLSWTVYYPSKTSCERSYCAPSWSWASVPDRVHFSRSTNNLELEFISADIKLASQDPYGAVLPSSSICLRGRLRTATLNKMKKKKPPILRERTDGRVYIDRQDGDLPLKIVCLELSHGKCLLLERAATEKCFRRFGLADLSAYSHEQDDFFSGLEKQTLTLV